MARGVNKVILVGHLGADPEVRYSQAGTAVARLSIATTERVPSGDGNWEDKTEWHRVVVFGRTAENCGNYLSKGRLVYVEGRLRTNQWEDAQGVKRYTTEIVAREVHFLDGSGGQPQREARPQNRPQPQGGEPGRQQAPAGDSWPGGEELPPMSGPPDDDIPF